MASDTITCPICKEDMLLPRVYACGHTICELCMINTDKIDKEAVLNTFTVPEYKCPLCRERSIIAWYLRPINRILLNIFRKNLEYEEKYQKYIKNKKDKTIEIPDSINLAELTTKHREEKADNIYRKILPILFEAAVDGKPFIIITHDNKNIQMVADVLSKRLFSQNNIYKLISTPKECTIELIPSRRSYKNEYTNSGFNAFGIDDMIIASNIPPPPPRPLPRIEDATNESIRNVFRRLRDGN